jgi:YD repeat-containing protein
MVICNCLKRGGKYCVFRGDRRIGYTCDVLDNLKSVTQGALAQRTFTYDMMGRLVTAFNPESGTICYGTKAGSTCTPNYDANGNLLRRVDANGQQTTYTYDALNRLHTKTYSDGVTPAVTMNYDEAGACPNSATAYNTGRLTSVTTPLLGVTPATVQTMFYDSLGRSCASAETVGTASPYTFKYQYNKAGGLTSETYPSGRVVGTSYDAMNRPAGVTSGATTYVNQASTVYASNSGLAKIALGNGLVEQWDYSGQRQQPRRVRLGTTGSPASIGQWEFRNCSTGDYTTECNTNNGNLMSETISPLGVTQRFTYDKVDRLKTAAEGATWTQTFVYDQSGNIGLLGAVGRRAGRKRRL